MFCKHVLCLINDAKSVVVGQDLKLFLRIQCNCFP